MFKALGVQWAGTLLGCVAVVMVPIPILFWKYGQKIRERSAFAPTRPFQAPSQDEDDDKSLPSGEKTGEERV